MNPLTRLTFAAGTLLLTTLAAGATATAAGGGLSITPAIIERTAVRGDTTSIAVVNSTSQPLKITVTPRPWTQSRTGAVAPNRHKTLLARVGVSTRSFTLPANGRRTVTLSVKSLPASGSLYGSIETTGLPTKTKKNGITAAYRLISTLRLNPSAAKRHLSLRASSPRITNRTILLPIKNTGNTVLPITGDIRIKGPAGTRSDTIPSTSILPTSTVNLSLGTTKGLPSGTYSATISLEQNGKTVLHTTKKLRVR